MASSNGQGPLWNQAANTWERYEQQRFRLFEQSLEACHVASGTYFLDARCGGGGLALCAARLGAYVAGFGISKEMIACASAEAGNGNLHAGDPNASPFRDDGFGLAIASECLFSDPVGARRELGHFSKKGGTVGIGDVLEPRHARGTEFARIPPGSVADGSRGRHEPNTSNRGARSE